MKRIPVLAAFAALALLTSCESGPPRPAYPDLSYAHLAPIMLNVADVQVVREYVSPGTRPNVEQMFPAVPAAVAERWARDRLRAAGREGVATVRIVNASVVEVALPRTGGVRGAVTTDQSERYDAVLEISVEASRRSDGRRAMVSSRAQRSRTVPEDITLNDREKVWFEMTEALMNDINAALERQIYDNFGDFVLRGAAPMSGPAPGASGGSGIRSEPLPAR
jgi:hypothetical protein